MRNISAPAPSLARRKLYIAMVTATQLMWAGQAQASPEGGNVVGGAGNINQSGKETIIHQQTDRMAIDWQSFNVKADEHVQFIQPNASSIALNRVVSNKGSEILGRIDANGQVFLVNPNGVVFGKDSQINAGGILASGLSINPTDFMNGNFTLSEVEGAEGKIVNSGIINAATGGSVSLLGKEVTNDGLIIANLGAVNLAVGKEAVVTFEKNGLVGVKVTKEVLQSELGVDAALINSGEINAEGGRILLTASTSQDIFSQAVNHEGMNAATSVVVNDDGSFTLGGGADVVNIGKISTSVANGDAGQIVVVGDKVTNSGAISADSQAGNGGHIELNSKDTTILNQTASVSAQSTTTGKGGDVKILGDKVGLMDTASVNASGANGGGQVLIGGDETGKNKSINNASFIYLGESTNIKTDALMSGNGGKLITFAQDTARIYGNLFARGGSESGNGGFIETSGLKGFEILNTPDVTAQNGLGGTWLIDPFDLTIDSTGTLTGSGPFDSVSDTSTLGMDVLARAMTNSSTVIISTGTGGTPGNGDITINTALLYNQQKTFGGNRFDNSAAKSTLILNAANNINVNQNIERDASGTGSLSIQLNANNGAGNSTTGSIIVAAGKLIDTKGGNFTATGENFTIKESSSNTNSILTSGGNVSLTMTGSVVLSGENNVTNPGTNTIATNGGNFTVIDSKGFDSSISIIDTSSTDHTGGGDIKITSTGVSNNVDLGVLKFGYAVPASNESSSLSRVGTVEVNSDGDVSLLKDLDFNNTGARKKVDGTRFTNAPANDPELKITAVGDITITGSIFDLYGDARDALDIKLKSTGSTGVITINEAIYTSGGNFTSESNSFKSTALIDTDHANDGTLRDNGNLTSADATWSNGGNVTINASQSVDLGRITTDSASINTPSGGRGNLEIKKINASDNLEVKQTTSAALSVFGATTFDLFNNNVTNSSISLTNAGNLFAGNIFLKSTGNVNLVNNQATVLGSSLGSSNIKGTFELTSTGDITDGGALNIDGTTTINAQNHSVVLDDANNFGGLVSFTNPITKLTLNDATTDALTVGAVTTNGGAGANGAIVIASAGSLVTGNLTTTKAASDAGAITLSATGSTLTAGTLSAEGGVVSGTSAGKNGGIINVTANSDINIGAISTKGSNASTAGVGGVGAGVSIISTTGNITSNAIITSGGNAAGGGNSAGGAAGTISLSADASTILLQNNLTAKGGTKAGSASDGDGKNITLIGDVKAKNAAGITIDSTGATSGTISFTKALDSDASQTTDLTFNGGSVSFSGDVGASNSLGRLVIASPLNNIGSGSSKQTINATSFDLTAKNIYANTLNSFGGAVDLSSTGIVSITKIDTHKNGVIGGEVVLTTGATNVNIGEVDTFGGLAGATGLAGGNITLNGQTLTLGILNSSGSNGAGTGGAAGAIKIYGKTINLNGDIKSEGGTGTTPGASSEATVDVNAIGGSVSLGKTTSAYASKIKLTNTNNDGTLTGQNIANTWSLGAAKTLNATPTSGVSFSGFNTLNGNANADNFAITNDFVGTIDGGNGANTFDIGASVTKIKSGSGNDTFNIKTPSALTTVIEDSSASDTDTLNADITRPNNWILGGATETLNAITTPSVSGITFSKVENLNGGNLVDTYKITGTRGGIIDAGLDDDIVEVDSDVTVDFAQTGISGIQNVEIIQNTSGSAKKITVTSLANSFIDWELSNFDGAGTLADNSNDGEITVRGATPLKSIKFVDFSTLVGGNGDDTFKFTGAAKVDGVVDGASGANGVDLSSATGDRTVEIGTTVNVANLTVTGINSITANSDATIATTLLVSSAATDTNIWTISGADSGLVKNITFTNFKNLTGGDGADIFDFSSAGNIGSVSGIIKGGSGSNNTIKARVAVDNTWAMLTNTSGSLSETANLATPYVKKFENIQNFTNSNLKTNTMDFAASVGDININLGTGVAGASGITTFVGNYTSTNGLNAEIVGANTPNTWQITDANKGIVGAINFEGFNKLTGGSNTDNFTITSSGSFVGTIDGGTSGTDSLTRNGSVATSWVLGAAKAGSVDTTDFSNIDSITGSGLDSLTGRDQDNDWNISGPGAGTVRSSLSAADQVSFAGMSDLTGLTHKDNFTLKSAGSLTGKIDGGAGTEKNKLTNETNGATWTLDKLATLSGKLNSQSFQNISDLIGSSAGTDTLVGRNQNNDWQITNPNIGTVQSVNNNADSTSFSGMSNLTGNALNDSFSITNGASVSGIINGGVGGTNTLSSNTLNATWVLDTTTAYKGTLSGKTFINISEISGNAGTLTGRNQANTWIISSAGSGTVQATDPMVSDTIKFSGMNNLNGNMFADSFSFDPTGSITGTLNGVAGTGENSISGRAGESIFAMNGANSGSIFDSSSVNPAIYAAFTNIQKITGRSTSDTLTGTNSPSTWTFELTNKLQIDGDTNHLEFAGIEKVQGGDAQDKFIFSAAFAGDANGGEGADIFNINAIVKNLLGGDGDDTFNLAVTGKATLIDGGANLNKLIVPDNPGALENLKNKWVLTSANKGSVTQANDNTYVTSFQSIQALQGSGTDSLTGLNQGNTWTISGENKGTLSATDNSNTINFSAMDRLIGGTGIDVFDFSKFNDSAITGSVDGGGTSGDTNNTIKGRSAKNSWIIDSDTSGKIKVFGPNGQMYVKSFLNIQNHETNDGDGVISDFWDISKNPPKNVTIEGTNSDSSKIIGSNSNNNWVITDKNTGTVTYTFGGQTFSVAFIGYSNLTGGNQDDRFSFSTGGAISGDVSGGGTTENSNAINTIAGLNDTANAWQMTGTNSGEVKAAGATDPYVKFQNIQKITGGNRVDTLYGITTGDATTVQGWQLNNTENIFFLGSPGSNIKFTGIENIEGGVGTNTLVNNAGAQNWVLTNANHGDVKSITFSKINIIQGSGSDGLIGRNQENNWQVTGSGSGKVSQTNFIVDDTLAFSGMNKLVGGTGTDVFTFGATGTIQDVDGGNSITDVNNSVVSKERANSWIIEPNGTSKLYAVGNTVAPVNFTNISNLTGGAGFADAFDIANITVVKGIIDGGAGTNNTLDLTKVANGVDVKIGVGASATADVKIANITQLTANGNNSNTLIADNIADNIFKITGANFGTLNIGLSFSGIANLSGRDLKDSFVFDGVNAKISGRIDGGLGEDTLDLLKLGANSNVAILNDNLLPIANAINITNVDVLNASSSFVNTLTASNKFNTWSINTLDGGTLSNPDLALPITFSNFSILVGGQKDDFFGFSQSGSLSGYIDGALQDTADVVDLSKLSGTVEIKLGNVGEGYRRIEKYIGNNADSILYGDDSANTWNLTGINEGDVNGTILFAGFTSLVGGKGDDIFQLLQGQLSGSIAGGVGQDTFNISNAIVDGSIKGEAGDDILNTTISDTSAESIRFVGGADANTVNVISKSGDTNTYFATHGSAVAGGGMLRYDVNNKTLNINYSDVKTVNDNLLADTLTIDGTAAADVFALSNNSYLLNSFTIMNYQNKNNVVVAGAANDKVSIAMPINIANTLTLKKAAVETTGSGLIRANGLVLDGAISVGSINNRLQTNVANLSVNTSAGDIYIQEQNGLNISGFTSNNKVDLILDGNLTSDVLLASIGQFNVQTTGNINLDKENALTGELNLKTTKGITLKNSTATTFGNLSADTLNVNSTGSIEGSGVITVGGIATFASGLDISLQNSQNDFNSVAVTNAHNVSLVDSNSLTLSTIGATGDIKTQSQGIILNGAVNGGTLSIDAGTGAANIANTVNVQTNVELAAQSIIVAGNIDAKSTIKATSVGDFTQAANLSSGSIELNVGKYLANVGVTTTATSGSISINAASDISVRNMTAVNDVILKAANDVSVGGALSTSAGKVDLLAGRNAILSSDVNGQTGINVVATNGSVQLQAGLNSAKGDVKVETSGDVMMAATASTSATEGNISYTGKNLTVTALSALNGEVTFTSTGAISDANADLTNISAKKFTVDAISGIGASDDIETIVSGLSLATQTGNIRIINTGEVTIDRMRANSNIYFSNYKGDVLLDNSANPVFGRTEPDALLAGGTMNSNYNLSDLFIRIDSGDLLMAPGYDKSKEMPAIVANNAKIDIAGGNFGMLGSPIIVYVRGDFVYTASRYTKPTWAFGARPLNPVKGPGVQTSLSDLISAGAEQLVVVEEINEINPAIFTNVRNYVYDDIAIMLPADQRYDDGSVSTN